MNARPALVLWCLLAAGLALGRDITKRRRAEVPAAPVRYDIRARYDDGAGRVFGDALITVTNPGPDSLRSVVVHLYPNATRDRSTNWARERERAGRFDFALAPARERGSFDLCRIQTGSQTRELGPESTDFHVRLSPALAPGESATLRAGFSLQLPAPFAEFGRRGRDCILSHWYPQVSLDTATGYHLFGHAPSEPADFDIVLDVPADLAVCANARLDDAPVNDWLRWPPGIRPGSRDPTRTWRFTASGITDLVAVLSPGLVLALDSTAGIHVRVYARHPVRLDWLAAAALAADMVKTFTRWYGPPPFRQLDIVQADGLAPADACYPGLVVLGTRPIPATRIFEATLARLVAAQWFAWPRSTDELAQPWLAFGPAVVAETRYMQLRHGATNLLDQPLLETLLRGAGAGYFHRLYDYVAASNDLLRDPASPLTDYRDAFEFSASQVSHAGLLFTRLADRLGTNAYDSLMRARPGPALLQSTIAGLAPATPPDLWRNHPSNKLVLRPLFSLPSFDEYQLFYGPYAWYDAYHGFQLAGWAMGRRFIDTGPLRGSHQWAFTETYFTKLDDWHSSLWYQTPLYFITPRTRVVVRADYSELTREARAGFQQEIGRVFGKPNALAELNYRLVDMRSTRLRKPEAWNIARTADIRFQLTHNYETVRFLGRERLFLARGLTQLGGNYDYWKLWLDQTHTYRLSRTAAIRLRAFAGAVSGSIPEQDKYYLSGGLTTNPDEPVSWSYQGISSGQEHWHYDADCNLRGYSGRYLHDKYAWALNLYLQPIPQLQPFLDIGNIGASLDDPALRAPRLDAGLRVKLGPLYADFPIWVSRPDSGQSPVAFRWMLGFRLSDLLGSN